MICVHLRAPTLFVYICNNLSMYTGFTELHFSDEGWGFLVGPGHAPRWVQPLLGRPLVEDRGMLFLQQPSGSALEPISLDQVRVTVSYFMVGVGSSMQRLRLKLYTKRRYQPGIQLWWEIRLLQMALGLGMGYASSWRWIRDNWSRWNEEFSAYFDTS